MRHLDSQWRLSIGGCFFVFVQAYCQNERSDMGQLSLGSYAHSCGDRMLAEEEA